MRIVDLAKPKDYTIQSAKDLNRLRILRFLKDGPKRFSELERISGRSPRGLSEMLKDLRKQGHIEFVIHKDRQAYAITKKGKELFSKFSMLGMTGTQIMEEGGKYVEDFSNQSATMLFCEYPWGIRDDILLDKDLTKLNPITKDTAIAIQEFLFKRIHSDYKNENIQIDKTKQGDILWGFSIDYKELVKSLKHNSLKRYNNITEEELDLCELRDKGTITLFENNLFGQFRANKMSYQLLKKEMKKLEKSIRKRLGKK